MTVLLIIAKSIKLVLDSAIHILFFQFILFFLSYRKKMHRRLGIFNKLLLAFVFLLFTISFIQSIYIFYLIFPVLDNSLITPNFFITQQSLNMVFQLKDFFIAILLSYLYYYKGKQE